MMIVLMIFQVQSRSKHAVVLSRCSGGAGLQRSRGAKVQVYRGARLQVAEVQRG